VAQASDRFDGGFNMTRTLSFLAGSWRLALAGATAALLLISLTGGVAQAAGGISNTTAPAISGTAQSGHTLTADPGSWSGDTSGGFSYQWQRCDTHGANCNPIAGATNATYTAQEFGATLVVEVTALDGPAVAASAATAVVRGPDPSGGSCVLVPNVGDADTTVFTITCENWSDYNQADPLTYSVQWWGCDIDGANCALEYQSTPTTVPRVEGILSGFHDTPGDDGSAADDQRPRVARRDAERRARRLVGQPDQLQLPVDELRLGVAGL
jgi:hypothetical protein